MAMQVRSIPFRQSNYFAIFLSYKPAEIKIEVGSTT